MRPSGMYGRIDARASLARAGRDSPHMATSTSLRLILASGSPARRELLSRAGFMFEVQPANIEEPTGAGFTDPRTYVQTVAWFKAAAVAARTGTGLILAADTVG